MTYQAKDFGVDPSTKLFKWGSYVIRLVFWGKKIAMVVIYENHKRNESQEVITTIQGIDEEKGQRKKKDIRGIWDI